MLASLLNDSDDFILTLNTFSLPTHKMLILTTIEKKEYTNYTLRKILLIP